MPVRILPFISGETYHVYNRGIDRRVTFASASEYRRALLALDYYRYAQQPYRLSWLLQLRVTLQQKLLAEQLKSPTSVEVLAYCLMPNHFHLLLKQTLDGGISSYLSQFQNSYTRFHNLRATRQGPLFMPQFKAVHIESEQQIAHVSRYIHLNPLTAGLVMDPNSLRQYSWSSLPEYLIPNQARLASPDQILGYFNSSPASYWQFLSSHPYTPEV